MLSRWEFVKKLLKSIFLKISTLDLKKVSVRYEPTCRLSRGICHIWGDLNARERPALDCGHLHPENGTVADMMICAGQTTVTSGTNRGAPLRGCSRLVVDAITWCTCFRTCATWGYHFGVGGQWCMGRSGDGVTAWVRARVPSRLLQ